MRGFWAVLALFSGVAVAQPVYSWTDENGEQHYSNVPQAIPAKVRARKVLGEAPAPTPGAKAVADSESATGSRPGVIPEVTPEVTPEPKVTGRAAEILAGIHRALREPSDAHRYDAAFGPSFVQLADLSSDPVVITAALKGMGTLYTPNPGAGASSNGKPYERLLCTDEVLRVALKRLDDDDFRVRMAAARVAEKGAWGPHPREHVLAALAARLKQEPDPGVQDELRSSLWSCHCARPELVEAALQGTSHQDLQSQLSGLHVMRKVGRNRRDFDRASRARMRRAAEKFLTAETHPVVHSAALQAWKATTHDSPGAVRLKLIELTRSTEPLLRCTAVKLLGDDTSLAAVPVLLAALDDTTSAEVRLPGALSSFGTCATAEQALYGLTRVSDTAMSRGAFRLTVARTPLTGADLQEQVARARAWAAANARALRLPQ